MQDQPSAGKPSAPVDQEFIDLIRARATLTAMGVMWRRPHLAGLFGIQHIWVPENNRDKYQIRDGNAPADQDRPKHLRGLHLWVDASKFMVRDARTLMARAREYSKDDKQDAATIALDAVTDYCILRLRGETETAADSLRRGLISSAVKAGEADAIVKEAELANILDMHQFMGK